MVLKATHEGLAAVMAGADGDAHLVDEGAEVVVMDAGKIKGEGALAVRGTVELDAVNLSEEFGRLSR